MALVKVRVHYELEFDVEVNENDDMDELVTNAADEMTGNLQRKDLDWLGTYVEDENGHEIMSIS